MRPPPCNPAIPDGRSTILLVQAAQGGDRFSSRGFPPGPFFVTQLLLPTPSYVDVILYRASTSGMNFPNDNPRSESKYRSSEARPRPRGQNIFQLLRTEIFTARQCNKLLRKIGLKEPCVHSRLRYRDPWSSMAGERGRAFETRWADCLCSAL